jgi:hypothetical protein
LLDFNESRSDGRYEFGNVPLLFGVNNLRLVFYGPQGQVRQEVRQIRIGPGQVSPSEHRYRLSVNQHNRNLFELDDEDTKVSDDHAKARVFGEYETGINRNISVAGRFASLPHEGKRHTYLGGAVRAGMGNVYGGVDVTGDLMGGWAAKAAAQTSVLGATLIGEHDRFVNFISEQTESDEDPLRRSTSLRLEGIARPWYLPHVPFSFKNTHDVTRSGDSSTSLENRLSTSIGRATYTNSLTWTYDKTDDSEERDLSGNFLIGGRVWDLHLRGRLNYDVVPTKELANANVSADWWINTDYNASFDVDMDLTEGGVTTFTTGVNTRFKHFSLGSEFTYDTGNDYSARITMSFSLAKDPQDGVRVRSGSLANSGLVSAKVYQDNNFNKTFDEGDTPLKAVGFKGGRYPAQGQTNDDGVAFVSGLPTDQKTDFSVDLATLEDPFSVADPDGVSVVLRPGVPMMLEFPVVSTGEVDGIVYRGQGEWATPVSDAVVQLVNAKGVLVKESKSAFDGFYLISYVRPGRYTLRVDPEQVARLGLRPPAPREIEIEANGTIVSAQDFVFREGGEGTRGETSFRVRLADFASRIDADRGWAKIAETLPESLSGSTSEVVTATPRDGGGKVFSLHAVGLPSRDAATKLCTTIRKSLGDLWCNPMMIEVR